MSPDQKLLAVDSVIGNGSVSLWTRGKEIDYRLGVDGVSLSESLLDMIGELCESNETEIKDIDCIAVSVGPGSYTGIRVGISTALGLTSSTGCKAIGIPTLKALALGVESETCLVVLSAGREEFVAQSFKREDGQVYESSKPKLIDFESIISSNEETIIVDRKTLDALMKLGLSEDESTEIKVASDNVAKLVGQLAQSPFYQESDANLTPFYTREFGLGK